MEFLGDICVPSAEPVDLENAKNIETLALYVCRNGAAFEEIVRKKEAANPAFSFLNNGQHSPYYRWILFCFRNGYSKDVIREVKVSVFSS